MLRNNIGRVGKWSIHFQNTLTGFSSSWGKHQPSVPKAQRGILFREEMIQFEEEIGKWSLMFAEQED